MSASYTARALAAARQQGFGEGVEDPDAVALIADLFARARQRRDQPPDPTRAPAGRSPTRPDP